jgi:murein DD-endopeptidase MepM/ murein hydrolase activator NlpD
MKMGKKARIALLSLVSLLVVGFLLPESLVIPVQDASRSDWNADTFWYEPWGKSGVHKGIDIFSPSGTPVISSTYGITLFQGELGIGGNVVVVLGPKWRIHYYAHLDRTDVGFGSVVNTSDAIGTVGTSGNAKGKSPHLHYTIVTLFPYFWRWDSATQGWKKMFFLDPGAALVSS